MKIIFFLILISAVNIGLINTDQHYKPVANNSFTVGEKLEYRIHYGFVNAAVATMTISDNLYKINGRSCYKVNIHGRSAGLFDFVTKINNNYGSYIDTAAIVPHKFYRYVEEGKYRKNEMVDFDHINDKAVTAKLDKKSKETLETKEQKVPDNVQDMVSGFYYIRTMDFKNIKKGEILTIKSFFDEEIYDFQIKFLGREELKTKLGTFNTLVLAPIMPENKLFDGENSVKVWISDDSNKIPIKVKASLFVGSVEIDLKSYTNARN